MCSQVLLLQDVTVVLSNITVKFFPCLPRKMSGRMTGCHFTPSRGCSTSLTWWRNLMETGRPESYGLSYRCTLPLTPSDTKHNTHLYDCINNLTCILCLLFPAEDPSVFHRCGNRPCSPARRPMGRQCGRVC